MVFKFKPAITRLTTAASLAVGCFREVFVPADVLDVHHQSRRVMETALTYTLQRVHWQFFGTLTFKECETAGTRAAQPGADVRIGGRASPKWPGTQIRTETQTEKQKRF